MIGKPFSNAVFITLLAYNILSQTLGEDVWHIHRSNIDPWSLPLLPARMFRGVIIWVNLDETQTPNM